MAAHLDKAKITFRRDLVRGACGGILETGWQVFALLLAVRVFEASPEVKATIAAAGPFGHLLSPLSLFIVTRLGLKAATAAALSFFLCAGFLVLAIVSHSLSWFLVSVMSAGIVFAQQAPLMVKIYSENYLPKTRGSMLSNSIVLTVISAALFSQFGGRLLDFDLDLYRWILVTMGAAAVISGCAVLTIPSTILPATASRNPLAHINHAWRDRTFGLMLLVWMLVGFGNLITLPLRVEYMANPAYGIDAANMEIAFVTVVVPSLARLCTTHFWGRLFDRLNFVIIRITINAGFLIGIVIFFNSTTLWMLGLAGAVFGVATAGGNIAWSLWVTKVAPDDKVADYMSVHTFTTGLRGIVAPYIGFALIAGYGPAVTSWVAFVLIGVSIIMLVPMRRLW